MTGLITPQPGWIAVKIAPAGMPIALSALCAGLVLHDGMAGDEEISEWYAALARDYDPVFSLSACYVDLEARHPHLLGWLTPLTKWMESYTDYQAGALTDVAQVLSTMSFSGAEEESGGDILAPVLAHLNTSGYKRSVVFDYVSPASMEIGIHLQGVLPDNSRMADLWCGTGTRVIAMANAMRAIGHDPHTVEWVLNTPNPTEIALTGINTVSHGLGRNVTLLCDRGWAETWGAANADPRVLRHLQPEVKSQIDSLKRRSLR